MEMSGRRRDGKDNVYISMGGEGKEVLSNKRIGGWDWGGCCPSVLQYLIDVLP